MSDLDTGHISSVCSACSDVAAANPSQDEIETVLEKRLCHEAIDNGLTDCRSIDLADRARIRLKPLAQRQKLTFPALFEVQCFATKQARQADAVCRAIAPGLINRREGCDA